MKKQTFESQFDLLAKFKPIPPGFVEDRRSVYWVDSLPLQPPTEFDMTPRLEELVKSKKYHKDFRPDRPSPIWKVSLRALTYPVSKRLDTLAEPKQYHKLFQPDRPVQTKVSEKSRKAKPTARLTVLARPKHFNSLLIKSNSSWEWGEWKSDIHKAALEHIPNTRLETLAEAKQTHKDYQGNRSTLWNVSNAAKSAQPSTRQHQLARPKMRTALDQDYDPYKVPYAAKNAIASPRIGELAAPIPRKIRTKK